MTENFRVWLDNEDDAAHGRVFTDANDVKQYIVDSVAAGHEVYADFAYLTHDGFGSPAGIEIVEGEWLDRLRHELSAPPEHQDGEQEEDQP